MGGSRGGAEVKVFAQPLVSGVQPATASEEGGTVVVVHGEGFPEFEPVRCKTGSVLGHAARWSSVIFGVYFRL